MKNNVNQPLTHKRSSHDPFFQTKKKKSKLGIDNREGVLRISRVRFDECCVRMRGRMVPVQVLCAAGVRRGRGRGRAPRRGRSARLSGPQRPRPPSRNGGCARRFGQGRHRNTSTINLPLLQNKKKICC